MKILVLAAAAMLPIAASAADPWPTKEKAAAVAACRNSILDNAVHEYLAREGLNGEPRGIREMLAVAGEPVLALCDCVINEFESKWTFTDFVKHESEYSAKVEELLASGACPVPKMSATSGN